MPRLLLVFLLIAGTSQAADAQQPSNEEKPIEVLPAPTPVTSYLPYYIPPSLPRPGTREVWQYYGVDSRGRWLPRVILAPGGAYEYHNGAPFRYTTTQPRAFMPYVLD